MPGDQWLRPTQNALKWGIVEQINRLGIQVRVQSEFALDSEPDQRGKSLFSRSARVCTASFNLGSPGVS